MLRTINQCYQMIRKLDNSTAVTLYLIRKVAQQNLVKNINVGSKFLIDYDELLKYLNMKGE